MKTIPYLVSLLQSTIPLSIFVILLGCATETPKYPLSPSKDGWLTTLGSENDAAIMEFTHIHITRKTPASDVTWRVDGSKLYLEKSRFEECLQILASANHLNAVLVSVDDDVPAASLRDTLMLLRDYGVKYISVFNFVEAILTRN